MLKCPFLSCSFALWTFPSYMVFYKVLSTCARVTHLEALASCKLRGLLTLFTNILNFLMLIPQTAGWLP